MNPKSRVPANRKPSKPEAKTAWIPPATGTGRKTGCVWIFSPLGVSMNTECRPLSPHLQVYQPQLTSVLSIFHRASGMWLALGALWLAYWLIAAAIGPDAFGEAQYLMDA